MKKLILIYVFMLLVSPLFAASPSFEQTTNIALAVLAGQGGGGSGGPQSFITNSASGASVALSDGNVLTAMAGQNVWTGAAGNGWNFGSGYGNIFLNGAWLDLGYTTGNYFTMGDDNGGWWIDPVNGTQFMKGGVHYYTGQNGAGYAYGQMGNPNGTLLWGNIGDPTTLSLGNGIEAYSGLYSNLAFALDADNGNITTLGNFLMPQGTYMQTNLVPANLPTVSGGVEFSFTGSDNNPFSTPLDGDGAGTLAITVTVYYYQITNGFKALAQSPIASSFGNQQASGDPNTDYYFDISADWSPVDGADGYVVNFQWNYQSLSLDFGNVTYFANVGDSGATPFDLSQTNFHVLLPTGTFVITTNGIGIGTNTDLANFRLDIRERAHIDNLQSTNVQSVIFSDDTGVLAKANNTMTKNGNEFVYGSKNFYNWISFYGYNYNGTPLIAECGNEGFWFNRPFYDSRFGHGGGTGYGNAGDVWQRYHDDTYGANGMRWAPLPSTAGVTTNLYIYDPVHNSTNLLIYQNGLLKQVNDGLLNNLLAYWSCWEAISGGTRADSTGNGYDLTDVNGNTSYTSGVLNNAASFDGYSGNLLTQSSVTCDPSINGETVAYWCYYSSSQSSWLAPLVSGANNLQMASFVDNAGGGGVLRVEISNGGTWPYLSTPSPFPTDQWVYVVITFAQDGTVLIYLNGSLVVGGNLGTYGSSGDGYPVFVGNAPDFSLQLVGALSDIGVWNTVLTPLQVSLLYNNGAGLPFSLFHH